MADQPKEVKLYGNEFGGYATMVHSALKLKGVAYEYVKEDLQNKSEELLRLNPVYKKVPVLVVDGEPIAESLVILQYIDDVWKNPPLLPEDPYKRAKVQFWADYVYHKLAPPASGIRRSEGDARKKAEEEFVANLITMEDGIREELWSAGGSFINGEKPGLLDVIMGSCYKGLKYLEDVAGVKLAEKDRTPLLCSCMEAFVELDVVKRP
ncbi:Glutathione S-transferase [Musa troglodytarum]|uniref:Glutathione S-transferase n=1 Tax=Musa troglodytarum TaxID=320322 RepID=A0A9E7FZF4_9LILI|nr:Glutathione S-transferase [Musa troglodytarum]